MREMTTASFRLIALSGPPPPSIARGFDVCLTLQPDRVSRGLRRGSKIEASLDIVSIEIDEKGAIERVATDARGAIVLGIQFQPQSMEAIDGLSRWRSKAQM